MAPYEVTVGEAQRGLIAVRQYMESNGSQPGVNLCDQLEDEMQKLSIKKMRQPKITEMFSSRRDATVDEAKEKRRRQQEQEDWEEEQQERRLQREFEDWEDQQRERYEEEKKKRPRQGDCT